MTRSLLAFAAVAAFAAPAHAAPDLPVQSPVRLVQEPGSCSSGYHDIGYVGPPGTRYRICQGSPIKQ